MSRKEPSQVSGLEGLRPEKKGKSAWPQAWGNKERLRQSLENAAIKNLEKTSSV